MQEFYKSLLIRYSLLLLVILLYLSSFFYISLLVLSHYILTVFLSLFYSFSSPQLGNFLFENSFSFLIVEACLAPAIFLILFHAFLATPMPLKLLFKNLFLSIGIFFLFNLLRMFILILIALEVSLVTFDSLHLFFYQGLSGVALGLIIIYFFPYVKGAPLPFITDIQRLMKKLK
jgi:exosortase/archaeosortase family protein